MKNKPTKTRRQPAVGFYWCRGPEEHPNCPERKIHPITAPKGGATRRKKPN